MAKETSATDGDLLRASLDRIRHGIIIYNRALIVISMNERAQEILKIGHDDFRVGDPFEKLARINAERGGYGGDTSVDERVARRMDKARSFEAFQDEQRLFYGNGLQVFGQPVGEDGFVITYTDITKRLDAELSANHSETRFRDFAETSSDWFWETDQNHRYVFISNTFRLETGFDPDEWFGQDRYQYIADQAVENRDWAAHQLEIDAREPFRDLKYSVTRLDGDEIWVNVSGRPIFDDDGKFRGYRGTAKNITDQISLETDLRAALEQARGASAAKSDFLSSMSHELRTPLNAIIGFSQLLDLDTEEPLTNSQREAVHEILRGGSHLISLIDQVLDLSGIESGNLSVAIAPAEPGLIVEECIALISGAAIERGLSLHHNNHAGSKQVMADPVRLKQVLLNLLTNAVKYNTTGEFVHLDVSLSATGRMRFAVSDDGPGIPIERQEDLFKPFDRLGIEAKGIEGTGIGLTISKKIVELMNGEIGVTSATNEGALFWFELPLWDGE